MLGSVRGFRVPRTPLAILVGLSLAVPHREWGRHRTGWASDLVGRQSPRQSRRGRIEQDGAGERTGDFSRFLCSAR